MWPPGHRGPFLEGLHCVVLSVLCNDMGEEKDHDFDPVRVSEKKASRPSISIQKNGVSPLVPAAQKKALPPAIEERDAIRRHGDTLVYALIEKIQKGDTFVDCVGWLISRHKMPLTAANELMNSAIAETVGKIDHSTWTATYRMLAQDLYKSAVSKGKISQANSILNNMVKLQHLQQSADLRTRQQQHQEEKFKAVFELPDGSEAEIKGKDSTQGFRVQIESYPTQSTRTETVEIVDSKPLLDK